MAQLLQLGTEVMAELLAIYEHQTALLLSDVRSHDRPTSQRAAHMLKGSSATLGLKEVARLAGRIESGATDPDTAEEIGPAVQQGLAALRSRIP